MVHVCWQVMVVSECLTTKRQWGWLAVGWFTNVELYMWIFSGFVSWNGTWFINIFVGSSIRITWINVTRKVRNVRGWSCHVEFHGISVIIFFDNFRIFNPQKQINNSVTQIVRLNNVIFAVKQLKTMPFRNFKNCAMSSLVLRQL